MDFKVRGLGSNPGECKKKTGGLDLKLGLGGQWD